MVLHLFSGWLGCNECPLFRPFSRVKQLYVLVESAQGLLHETFSFMCHVRAFFRLNFYQPFWEHRIQRIQFCPSVQKERERAFWMQLTMCNKQCENGSPCPVLLHYSNWAVSQKVNPLLLHERFRIDKQTKIASKHLFFLPRSSFFHPAFPFPPSFSP